MPEVTISANRPPPKSCDFDGNAWLSDRSDFLRSLISPMLSSSAAVISQLAFLNKPYGGRTFTDRVLRISASCPRSRLMFSRPSSSDSVLYVLTFIVLQLPGIRFAHWAECHSAK